MPWGGWEGQYAVFGGSRAVLVKGAVAMEGLVLVMVVLLRWGWVGFVILDERRIAPVAFFAALGGLCGCCPCVSGLCGCWITRLGWGCCRWSVVLAVPAGLYQTGDVALKGRGAV